MTHTTTDAAEARALNTHPCWTETLGGRLSHRHWFHRDQLQPTCERCSTPIDREHNEVGPVAWEPPVKPHRLATAEAASGAKGTFACPVCGDDTPHHHAKEPMQCPECKIGRPGHLATCSRATVAVLGPRVATVAAEAASGAGGKIAAELTAYRRDQADDEYITVSGSLVDDAIAALASLPPATDPAMVLDPTVIELVSEAAKAYEAFEKARAAMNAATPSLDATPAERALYDERYKADHAAEREHWATAIRLAQAAPAIRAAFAAAPTIPATGEAIRAVTAEMRRFMPTACGDWADKIDAALAAEKGRKVAFYDEGGIDIRPGESLADRDRRIYQQGRHDALNDEPEAFI